MDKKSKLYKVANPNEIKKGKKTKLEFKMFYPNYGNSISLYTKDDIVWTSGAFVSPAWYRKYVFPCYKRYIDPLKQAGKKILYTSDGNYTEFIDDVASCHFDGFVLEPTTDMAYIAEKYGMTILTENWDNDATKFSTGKHFCLNTSSPTCTTLRIAIAILLSYLFIFTFVKCEVYTRFTSSKQNDNRQNAEIQAVQGTASTS